MENSKINITGDKAKLENIKITGSKSNDVFVQVANRCNGDKNPLQCLMNEVLANPTTIYSPLIVSSYLAPYLNMSDLTELVGKLDGDAKTMYQYKLLQDFIAESKTSEAIGEKAPDFTLTSDKNKDIQLTTFIQGKRYILIDFWASDVPQCAVDAKDLSVAYRKYQSKGFEILSISLDENRDLWLKAVSQQNRKWANVSDLKRWQSAVTKLYKIESLPSNVLIDDKGTIIARNLKGEHLINTLNQVFSK